MQLLLSSLLSSLGFDPFFAFSHPDLVPARVTCDLGAQLAIAGARAPVAELAGRLRHELADHERPTVGDWVAVADGDDRAIVHHVLPRRTAMFRRAAGTRDRPQAIAANVDRFLIVTSANKDANPRRLERYLAAVHDSGAQPVVVVNKSDLGDGPDVAMICASLARVAAGVPVVAVSARTGAGLDALAAHLAPGRTIALVGSSGVGKSSLVNRLLGEDRQVIAAIDENDRGRHATTRRELVVLPGDRGVLIDTPGMREFGLVDDGGLADGFADVTALAARCRFTDCRHTDEPGCAVVAAIDDGRLDPARLDALHKLERELAAAERRTNPLVGARERQKWKANHMAMRARMKVDPKLRR